MPSIIEMERLGWGNPDDPAYRTKHIVEVTEGGRTFRVRRETAPLFKALLIFMDKNGVDIDAGILDDWSYVNRDIRGYPGVKSYHAWGLAIDIDATKNALGSLGTSFPINKTQDAIKATSLTWGYNWRPPSRPDPMHFEFRGTPEQAKQALTRLKVSNPLIYRRAIA